MFNDLNFINQLDPDENHFQECYDSLIDPICNYIPIADYIVRTRNYGSNLNILNYNIRSFSANFDSFISIFDNFDSTPDILILTETWFNENSIKDIPYFNCHHTIRTSRRSGGVSVYVKDNINSRKIEQLSFCANSIEVCTVEVSSNSNIIYFISVYRPHSYFFDDFLNTLDRLLKNDLIKNRHVIVLGDFNINHLDCSNRTNSFTNCMQSFYFIPLITKPTRFSLTDTNSSSLLDQIWTNRPILSYDCGILNFDLTDHLPTFYHIPFDLNSQRNETKIKITFRIKNDFTNINFSQALMNQNWDFLDGLDINQSIKSFIDQLNLLYDKNFPIKTKYVSIKKSLSPWINDDISRLIKYRSNYYSLMQRNLVSQDENKVVKNKVN